MTILRCFSFAVDSVRPNLDPRPLAPAPLDPHVGAHPFVARYDNDAVSNAPCPFNRCPDRRRAASGSPRPGRWLLSVPAEGVLRAWGALSAESFMTPPPPPFFKVQWLWSYAYMPGVVGSDPATLTAIPDDHRHQSGDGPCGTVVGNSTSFKTRPGIVHRAPIWEGCYGSLGTEVECPMVAPGVPRQTRRDGETGGEGPGVGSAPYVQLGERPMAPPPPPPHPKGTGCSQTVFTLPMGVKYFVVVCTVSICHGAPMADGEGQGRIRMAVHRQRRGCPPPPPLDPPLPRPK